MIVSSPLRVVLPESFEANAIAADPRSGQTSRAQTPCPPQPLLLNIDISIFDVFCFTEAFWARVPSKLLMLKEQLCVTSACVGELVT